MVPENIVWAFFSPTKYRQSYKDAIYNGEIPKDVYYKHVNGNWVKTTKVFNCIDEARRNYRVRDVKYIGPVLEDTKSECERGSLWPPLSEEKIKLKREGKTAPIRPIPYFFNNIENFDEYSFNLD